MENYKPYYQSSWALIIGINTYQHVSPLSYACNDADAMAKILINELGFPKDNTIMLKDHNATKQAIMEKFLGLSDRACNPDDRVLVFYAGHGLTIQGLRGPIGYLIPVDGNPDNKNSLIRWDDLTRNADLIPAKHILFIMDACYSGLALQRAVAPGAQRFLSDMLQRVARQVITAGKADEAVADGGGAQGRNSIFTGYLIEGLEGAASDPNGIITANELMSYVYKKVGQDNRSKQTPHYGHFDGDGDFILQTPNREHLTDALQKEYLIKPPVEEPGVPSDVIIPKPSFVIKNGYGDPTSPNFGRNSWSSKLGEYRRGKELSPEVSRAFSWVSLIVEPIAAVSQPIDIAGLSIIMKSHKPTGDEPYERLNVPRGLMTTIDSTVQFDELSNNNEFWGCYIRVDRNGNFEIADAQNTFIELDGIRCFYYVQIIGLIWQSLFFVKNLLINLGYRSGVKIWVNLVGTRESILGDFSKETGEDNKHWMSPFDRGGFFEQDHLFKLKCPDLNLQMEYQFVLEDLDESISFEKIIKNIAGNLSLAYNHQSQPRCFNYNTEIFPWTQYLNGRRW